MWFELEAHFGVVHIRIVHPIFDGGTVDDVQLPACNLGNELISITLVIFSVEDFGSLGMGNPFVETGEAFHGFNQGRVVTLVSITALLHGFADGEHRFPTSKHVGIGGDILRVGLAGTGRIYPDCITVDFFSSSGIGLIITVFVSMLIGAVALRTSGVSFLIVTLMFGQTAFLSVLYFDQFTLGQDGFTLTKELQPLVLGSTSFSYTDPNFKYNAAWLLFAVCLILSNLLILSPIGRVLIAIRENEERTQMLGYNTYLYKLFALTLSGTLSGLAGSVHALLFSYVGATFAEIHHSIAPLLWTLLGGVGTTLGPLVGTGIMHYLIDFTSGWTSAYLLIVGAILVLLVIGAPQGLMGMIRQKWMQWLP